ncbi:unnamed protein product [Ilex paraguariensis]|uniref:Neprosin activation peptide domain-containing protein n=1 Tax=Ilex paraguariensis TaxID=185542 RepID=A0ABC8R533_9AQUA
MDIVGRKKGFQALLLHLLLPFLVVVFSERTLAVSSLNYTKYRQVGSLRLARIQKHLDQINKPAVLTIESSDGDIIDCVHKRKQPALDHPLLKKHKIQRVPPERPKMKIMKTDEVRETNRSSLRGAAWQTWHENGQRCPKGTVPIRRSSVHDVLRAKSLYDFGKKHRPIQLARRTDAPDVVSGNGHEVIVNHLTPLK